MIYFDNASTTLMKPPEVVAAVSSAMATFGGYGRGVHTASIAAGMAVHDTREKIARLFNAPTADGVSFTANATESLNIIVEGLLKLGDHVITTAASHNSVLRPLYRKQAQGCDLSILKVSTDAMIDYDELESLFKPTSRLVLVTHSSNLTGDVYDVGRIARLCKERGVLCAIDAAQTAGSAPIDMTATGIDVVAFTGHKNLFGPQGTGGLCLNEGVSIEPFIVGGASSQSFERNHPLSMPDRLEAGTLNSHGIHGLSAGLDYIQRIGLEKISAKVSGLVKRFESGIKRIDSVTVYGRVDGQAGCGIVALNVGNLDSAFVAERLNTDFAICTRSGTHCAPLMHEALGTVEQGAVRFSFSCFNTDEEIDAGIAALKTIEGSSRT